MYKAVQSLKKKKGGVCKLLEIRKLTPILWSKNRSNVQNLFSLNGALKWASM